MDDDQTHLWELRHGVLSTADARSLGIGHPQIRSLVARGEWQRLRRGYYVRTAEWRAATPEQRHLLQSRAVRRDNPGAVLSHTSAAVAMGVQLYQPDLSVVHLTQLDGQHSRSEHGVKHHVPVGVDGSAYSVRPGDADLVVLTPTLAVAGAMSIATLEQAVVLADSALRQKVVVHDDLRAMIMDSVRVPNTRHSRLAARLMDGRSGSPGESRSRLVFWRDGIPTPDLQVRIVHPTLGVFYGDFGWEEEHVIGECDGLIKYQGTLWPGESPSQAVIREKRREDGMTELDRIVRRWVTPEIDQPRVLTARIRSALSLGRRRYVDLGARTVATGHAGPETTH